VSATLGIGTATFLAGYGLGAAMRPDADLLAAAVAAGVAYLDTAADYGESEIAVGRVRAPGVRVSTKVKPSEAFAAVEASCARLQGPVDTILMHSAAAEQLGSAPAIDALQEAKARGLASRIGASTYGADAASAALARSWVDVVQVEYSIVNQSVLRALDARGVRARGQEVVARSVLCKGLLTSRRTAAPDLVSDVREAIEEIERCAREWRHSIETLAIRFALDSPGVDVVLVGVSSASELDVALAAARAEPLTQDQWKRLASLDRSGADAVHPERWSRVS